MAYFSGLRFHIVLIYNVHTVDSALNELGYNEISEFLNIYFLLTEFF